MLVILSTPSSDVVPDVSRITVIKMATDLTESEHLCKICCEKRGDNEGKTQEENYHQNERLNGNDWEFFNQMLSL